MCLTGYIFVSCNHYRSLDFLPAVFKLFPVSTACLCQSVCLFVCVHVCIALSLFTHVVQDYDFLVLTQPHASPEFPLLSHFTVSVTKPVSPHMYNTIMVYLTTCLTYREFHHTQRAHYPRNCTFSTSALSSSELYQTELKLC